MENRETQTEAVTPTFGIAGALRETARVAIDMTKILVKEATPELEEAYATYDATLKFLERKHLPDLQAEEKDEDELETVRNELAALTGKREDESPTPTINASVSPQPAQAAISHA